MIEMGVPKIRGPNTNQKRDPQFIARHLLDREFDNPGWPHFRLVLAPEAGLDNRP